MLRAWNSYVAAICCLTVSTLAASTLTLSTLSAAEPPLKALIIDGQNNHAWQQTTPVLKEILTTSGRFTVDVASYTKETKAEDFRPKFADYAVVVSNYNGAAWPEPVKDAFVEYMKNGGGFVVVHAADNAFADWPEYNQMIGLGGWGGRNEKAGPYVRLRDGQIVRDETKGSGGHHGKQHPFVVETFEAEHPILKGLPAKWMHAQDELYDRLRGPARHLTVLATAYSDPATGGSGEREPILFTIDYEKGRVFHTVLGHSTGAMQCVGFQTTLIRGTEWAATGKVTQTETPQDFPTEKEVSARK